MLEDLNRRPFQKLPGCRRQAFEDIDQPALQPLPARPYQFAEWKKATVHIDYHVELEGHYYSVPYRLAGKKLDLRYTPHTVECFCQGTRVASHLRCRLRGRHTTLQGHMPPNHQRWLDWTPERFGRWAQKIGPACSSLITTIINSRPLPQRGFRSALGILRLEKDYGPTRLEMACHRALDIGAPATPASSPFSRAAWNAMGRPNLPRFLPPVNMRTSAGPPITANPKKDHSRCSLIPCLKNSPPCGCSACCLPSRA